MLLLQAAPHGVSRLSHAVALPKLALIRIMIAMTFDDNMTICLYGAVPDSIVDGPGLRYAVFVQGCSHGCPGCHNPDSQPVEGGTVTTVEAVLADIRANSLVHDVTLSGGEPFEQAAACAVLARQLKAEGYGIWTYTGYLYEDLLRCAEGTERVGSEGSGRPDFQHAEQPGLERSGQMSPKGAGCLDAEGGAQTVEPAFAQGLSRPDAPAGGEGSAHGLARACARLDAQGVHDLLECTDVLVDGPFVESLKSLSLKWCGSANQRLIDVPATRAAGRVVEWKPQEFAFEKPASW